MISCLLAVQACSLASGSEGTAASGQVAQPTYDVGPDGTPLAGWQADTADTVARVLTRQEVGAVIAGTTSGEPRIAESLRAAAALRQLGWRTNVDLGIDRVDGLVREGSQEPLLLTRLQALATGETTAKTRSEVRQRLQSLRPGLARHDPAAVIATLSGLDVLELGGDLRAADLPTEKLCPAADEVQVVVATGLLSLAGRAGRTCDGAATWTERANQAVLETEPTPQGQEIALTAARFLAESGHRVEVPAGCLDLLRQQSAYRELVPPIAYQICAELGQFAGATVEVNAHAAGDLELFAETGGRIDDALQIDAVSLHYSVLVLRLLGFGAEHVAAVRESPLVSNATALDKVRIAVAQVPAAELPAALPVPDPADSPDDSYAAAMAVNAGGTCPAGWPARPSWRTDKSGTVDSFALLRHATIAAAQATCSNRQVSASERRRIVEAADALDHGASQSTRGKAALTDLWKASESKCLAGVEPELTDSVLTLLPDYSDLTKTDVDLSRLIAAVRLSDLARHGCGATRWPLAGN